MKLVVTVLCLYIICIVKAQRYYPYNYNYNTNHIPILRYQYDPNPDGSYTYSYETGNGISAQERGYLKGVGVEGAQVKEGGFAYTGPDGVVYSTKYVADENGYRPEGAHLPKSPPIPDAIQRSLAYNAAYPGYDGRYYGK